MGKQYQYIVGYDDNEEPIYHLSGSWSTIIQQAKDLIESSKNDDNDRVRVMKLAEIMCNTSAVWGYCYIGQCEGIERFKHVYDKWGEAIERDAPTDDRLYDLGMQFHNALKTFYTRTEHSRATNRDGMLNCLDSAIAISQLIDERALELQQK